jgi:NADPH2:quinone reductase
VRPGDRVAATTPFGGFAEVAAAPALVTFPIPEDMPFEVAAGFVVNHQTAHLGLVRRGRLREGETVLVHGAAGGVGSASIQVARAAGAGKVIAIASSEEKRGAALDEGADLAFDPAGDWVAHVREATGGRGADVVVDPVGGEAFTLSLKCLAPEGRLLVVGFASGEIPTVAANRLLLRHQDVVGVNYGGFLAVDQEFQHAAHRDLMTWWAEGRLRAIPGLAYPMEEVAAGLEAFAERRVTGKPVLRVR